jgi:aryl-alcohol dehydrogenase-like predicted oxidoreductase
MEAYGPRSRQERTWDVVDAVRTVADARGVPMAQVALAWLLSRPVVSSVILGARTTPQLVDNLGAVDVELGEAELTALDAASDPGTPDYPYGAPGLEQRTRTVSGGRD